MDLDYDSLDETLTITNADINLRLNLTPEELRSLAQVESADWSERRSIRAGAALDQPAHWCVGSEPGTALVLVGSDDETWFLAVTVPLAELHALAAGPAGG